MSDRDTLQELYDIVFSEAKRIPLPMTASALPFLKFYFGYGFDIFYRRRLSVCRMLIDLHLPVSAEVLDILLAVTLCHYLPSDTVPADHLETLGRIFSHEPEIAKILAILQNTSDDYYERLKSNPYALLIRLTERGVLVECLYEESAADALAFIRETRKHFFSLCIYAKEHYREFLGPVSILMEKTRNLVTANETLLKRYEDQQSALSSEILSL